jgi:hypothetical protein
MDVPLGILWAEPLSPLPTQPLHSNVVAVPHVTLAWGVEPGKYDVEGVVTSIYFESDCWNDRTQAVTCQLQLGIPFELAIPHLTVSWIDDTRPVESTEMLRRKHKSKPMEVLTPCQIKWIAFPDSAAIWRQKALGAIEQSNSMYEAARALGVPRSTLRSRFENLPGEHPDRVRYFTEKKK